MDKPWLIILLNICINGGGVSERENYCLNYYDKNLGEILTFCERSYASMSTKQKT